MRILEYKGMDFAIAIVIGIIIVMLIYGYKIHCNKRERFNVGCQAPGPTSGPTSPPGPTPGPTRAPALTMDTCPYTEKSQETIPADYRSLAYDRCAKYKVTPWKHTGPHVTPNDVEIISINSDQTTTAGQQGLRDICNPSATEILAAQACATADAGTPDLLMNSSGILYSPDVCKPNFGGAGWNDVCDPLGRKDCNNASVSGAYVCHFDDSQNPNLPEIVSHQEQFDKLAVYADQLCSYDKDRDRGILTDSDKYICRAGPRNKSRAQLAKKCHWSDSSNTRMFRNIPPAPPGSPPARQSIPYAAPNNLCLTEFNQSATTPINSASAASQALKNIYAMGNNDLTCVDTCGISRTDIPHRRLLNNNEDDDTVFISRNYKERLRYLADWMNDYNTRTTSTTGYLSDFIGRTGSGLAGYFDITAPGGGGGGGQGFVLVHDLDIAKVSYLTFLRQSTMAPPPNPIDFFYYINNDQSNTLDDTNISNKFFGTNGKRDINLLLTGMGSPNAVAGSHVYREAVKKAITYTHLAYHSIDTRSGRPSTVPGSNTRFYNIEEIRGIANTFIYKNEIIHDGLTQEPRRTPRFLFQTFLTHAHLYRIFSRNGIPTDCLNKMNGMVKFKVTETRGGAASWMKGTTDPNPGKIFIINNPKLPPLNPGPDEPPSYLAGSNHRPGIILFEKGRNGKYRINLGRQRLVTDQAVFGFAPGDVNDQFIKNSFLVSGFPGFTSLDNIGELDRNQLFRAQSQDVTRNPSIEFLARNRTTISDENLYYYYMFVLLIYINNNVEFEEYTIMGAESLEKLMEVMFNQAIDQISRTVPAPVPAPTPTSSPGPTPTPTPPIPDPVLTHLSDLKQGISLILNNENSKNIRSYLVYLMNHKSESNKIYDNALSFMRLDTLLLGDYLRIVQHMKPEEYIKAYIHQNKLETLDRTLTAPVETSFPLNIFNILHTRGTFSSDANHSFQRMTQDIYSNAESINQTTGAISIPFNLTRIGEKLEEFEMKVWYSYRRTRGGAAVTRNYTKIEPDRLPDPPTAEFNVGFDFNLIDSQSNQVGNRSSSTLNYKTYFGMFQSLSNLTANEDKTLMAQLFLESGLPPPPPPPPSFDPGPGGPPPSGASGGVSSTDPTPVPTPVPISNMPPGNDKWAMTLFTILALVAGSSVGRRRRMLELSHDYSGDGPSYSNFSRYVTETIKKLMMKRPRLINRVIWPDPVDKRNILHIDTTSDVFIPGMADITYAAKLQTTCASNQPEIILSQAIRLLQKTPDVTTTMFVLTRPYAGISIYDKRFSAVNRARSAVDINELKILQCLTGNYRCDPNIIKGNFCVDKDHLTCDYFEKYDYPIGEPVPGGERTKVWDPSNSATALGLPGGPLVSAMDNAGNTLTLKDIIDNSCTSPAPTPPPTPVARPDQGAGLLGRCYGPPLSTCASHGETIESQCTSQLQTTGSSPRDACLWNGPRPSPFTVGQTDECYDTRSGRALTAFGCNQFAYNQTSCQGLANTPLPQSQRDLVGHCAWGPRP